VADVLMDKIGKALAYIEGRHAGEPVSGVPRLLDAVRGMLEGHRREETDWGPVCGGCWGRLGKNAWPCPSVRAAAMALFETVAGQ
jgi:hypothetical protein